MTLRLFDTLVQLTYQLCFFIMWDTTKTLERRSQVTKALLPLSFLRLGETLLLFHAAITAAQIGFNS